MNIETTADLVRVQAKNLPDKPVFTFADRPTTWTELDTRSNQVAQALIAAGVGPQDRVAFLAYNTPEHFEVLFGCAKAGAVFVPINWRLAPPEVAFVLNHCHAKVLIAGEGAIDLVDPIESDLDTVQTIVVLGEHERHRTYAEWVDVQIANDPAVTSSAHDVMLQMYTSGTTGLPKGVMLTNDNFWGIAPATTEWGILENSVVLVCMPLFHMAGTGWSLTALYQGASLVLLRDPDPNEIVKVMPKYGVTDTLFVPALLQFLLARPDISSVDFSALRNIFYGASPITGETLRQSIATFGCGFNQLYGLTESTGAGTWLAPSDHDPDGDPERLRSCGRAIPGLELRIADAVGAECGPGEVGEIWIRGRVVMKGYWNQPDETSRAITEDGWLKSGDAAYRDADGYVFIHDRVKDMIVSGGENVYPAEVESALHSHEGIADIAVIGVPDERWGETVKAVVVRAPGREATEAEIIEYARARIAHYKCPTSVDFVDELPRNPSGKILKRDLREPYWEGHTRRVQ